MLSDIKFYSFFILKKSFVATALLVMGLASACTKEKPLMPQHRGQVVNNLYKFKTSELDGRTFLLQTGKAKQSENTSVSVETKINLEKFRSASYPFVEYSVPPEIEHLLGSFEFIGRPHHTYQMRIELDDEKLWLYAVAPKSDISSQLFHVADPIGELDVEGRELYKVAIMGMPVTYLTVEVIIDSYGKPTSRTTEYPVFKKDMSRHVHLHHFQKTQFKYLEKVDVYPADLFEGDWYFAETIVATIAGEEGAQGGSSNLLGVTDSSLTESTKLRFVRDRDKIRGININIDDRLDETDEVNFQTVVEMPVQWKDFRIKPNGNSLALSEEEVPDTHWRDKNFGEFKFSEIRTASLGSQVNNTALANRELVGLEISENYRSYTIFLHRRNVRVRHSFMRANKRSYTPKVAYRDDMQKFGYFTTTKKVLDTFEIARIEDLDNLVMINRFDISQGETVYHFTKTSPSHLRSVGELAITAWNEAFEEAGVDFKLRLEKDKDVELGDLRYNAINIIESISGSGSYGFGPSIVDPQTGEIISATSNVWSTPMRNTIIHFLRVYVRNQLGLHDESLRSMLAGVDLSEFKGPAAQLLPESILQGELFNRGFFMSASEGKEIFNLGGHDSVLEPLGLQDKMGMALDHFQRKERMYGQNLLEAAVEKHGKIAHWNPVLMKNFGREFEFNVSFGSLIDEMNEVTECEPFRQYIQDLKESEKIVNERESEVLLSCSKKLLMERMLGVLVHELGHNLGLRHNFKGSLDKTNFLSTGDREGSSIMEYYGYGAKQLLEPGAYDVAALRFGYGNTVEAAKDGELVKLDTSRPISHQVEAKPYAFCTDEHSVQFVGQPWSQYNDPKCDLWDRGTNAEEIMKFTLASYVESFISSHQRIDRIWPSSNNQFMNIGLILALRRARYLKKAKLFYDHWRAQLAHFLPLGEEYLEAWGGGAYEAKLAEMAKEERVNGDGRPYKVVFKELKPAADLAFKMLMDIAFMPNRYCLLESNDGSLRAIELEELRQQAYWNMDGGDVHHCGDELVKKILSGSGQGQSILELGSYLDDLKFDMDPDKDFEPLDILGSKWDRMLAIITLGERFSSSSFHRSRNFHPNFFDEPEKRRELINRIISRVLIGVSPKDFKVSENEFFREKVSQELLSQLNEMSNKGRGFTQFKHEKELVSLFYGNLLRGLMIPGKSSENSIRRQPFFVSVTDHPTVIEQAVAKYNLGGSHFAVAFKSNAVAALLINRLIYLGQLKNYQQLDPESPLARHIEATYDLFAEQPLGGQLVDGQSVEKLPIEVFYEGELGEFGKNGKIAIKFEVKKIGATVETEEIQVNVEDEVEDVNTATPGAMTYTEYVRLMNHIQSLGAAPYWIRLQLSAAFKADFYIFYYLQSLTDEERLKVIDENDMRQTYANITSAPEFPLPNYPFRFYKSPEWDAFWKDIVSQNNMEFYPIYKG